ncbi:hypothetical protein LPC08_18350 [Roseomonas sp. OT10]|uniref:hypothetical protein n=1 Tax=Roseomonas cutis TaxID=2897332 RepID=UPI001E39427C|nr:hypothetical protein [Roseomonas sp. OT10]UFN47957.1 hypothetical protein LPC08_18350 [Roseomonas sp. OT10]
MGGLFRAPKPVTLPVAQTATTVPVATAASAAPAPAEAPRERARRGVAGTIATSDRGVVTPLSSLPLAGRKTLLGE